MYSPDGRTLAAGSLEGPIWLWNVQTGERLHTLTEPEFETHCLVYSPDSATLVSGSLDAIRFWEVHSGQLLNTIPENVARANSGISLSPDGDTAAIATDEGVIRLLDTRTRKVTTTLRGHTRSVTTVAFSFNRSLLASGSEDRTIRLWHVDTGELLFTFPEQSNWITSIAFAPDGQTIASGTSGEIYISDLATGKHTATLTGHTSWIRSVAFSPDGQTLVSGSDDCTVMLWDLTHIQRQND